METPSPSLLRKYITEYVILGLVSCVVYLFLALNSLNSYVRNDYANKNSEMIKAIQSNTDVLNRFLIFQNTKQNGQSN